MKSPFRTEPLSDVLGCEVLGQSLRDLRAPSQITALHELLARRSLLLFRDQDIEPAEQVAFSQALGPLESHVLSDFCLPGQPEVFVVSNIVEQGRHIGAYGGSKQFHTDLAYIAEPSLGSVFRCLECPDTGGETEFVSMSAAFEAMPSDDCEWLQQQTAVYDYVWDYPRRQTQRPPLTEAQKAKVPAVRHPCVRSHPVTGRKSIFLTPIWVRCLEGLSEDESAARVNEVCAFATQARFRYAHRWREGDVLIWDNRSTLHRQLPFDDVNQRRLMHRTTIRGDRPFLTA